MKQNGLIIVGIMSVFAATPHSVVLPLLGSFPATMAPLQERIQDLGYVYLNCSTPELIQVAEISPFTEVALVPISNQTSLDELFNVIVQLRQKLADVKAIAVYSGKTRFKIPELYRAGVNAIFQSPFEEELLINKLFELWPAEVGTKDLTFDQLMRVNLVEIEHAKVLNFDVFVYLPMNRKAILYLEHDRAIDERVVRKFKTNAHYSLYIRRSDLKKYLKYCGALLRGHPTDTALAQVEADHHFVERLGGVMGGFFSDENMSEDESRAMLENLKSVVGEFEDRSGSKADVVKSVSRFAAHQMTHYTHAQNVAAYCCLFGMALGIMEPETLRMGGLLHDLGLSDLPNSLIGRELKDMSEEDAAKYKLHPGGGKYSIEEKKLQVPPGVIEMVLYHHERMDGSGYPYGKKGAEISALAKVCAIADEFDKLTSVRPGYKQLSPVEAMKRIAGLDGKPAMSVYDPEFHKPLLELFMSSKVAPITEIKAAEKAKSSAAPASFAEPRAHGPVVTIEALLSSPKFAKRPESAIEVHEASAQVLLQDLRSQLASHFVLAGLTASND